jgi:plastocyanin
MKKLLAILFFFSLIIEMPLIFAQCEADHIVILNNSEFVPSELVIVPGESVAFINIEGIHNLDGYNFNNPVDYFLDDTTGTPEGVCMGIIEFDTPGIYNFNSSYEFDAQLGMSLTIYNVTDTFVLEDLFAEVNALDSVSKALRARTNKGSFTGQVIFKNNWTAISFFKTQIIYI